MKWHSNKDLPGGQHLAPSDIARRQLNKVRGRPFDSEGGGGLSLLVGTDYLLSSRARQNQGQNIYFQPQQIFEKAKKQKTKTKKKGGGVSARV